MLMVQNFEILSYILLISLRCRILRVFRRITNMLTGTEFWCFIRYISNNFRMQTFEVLFDKLVTCLRGQNFEVLSEKLRTRSRCRILRFYPTNCKNARGIEFWKCVLKINNKLTGQNWGFVRQIRDILMVGNFVVLPDIFYIDPVCT